MQLKFKECKERGSNAIKLLVGNQSSEISMFVVFRLVYPGTLFGCNFMLQKCDFPNSVPGYSIWKTPVLY